MPTPATATVRPDSVGEPQRVLGGGAHALEDAVGGQHRGVAAAAVGLRAAVRVAGLAGDDVEVGVVGADVAGGEVPAAQRLDEPAVGAQQRLGLVGARVADDHGLAAAEVEPGEAVLVGHRPGQRAARRRRRPSSLGVRVEPGAAERRAQRRRVDGDDRLQPRLRVAAEHDLFMVRAENLHVHEPRSARGVARRWDARGSGRSRRGAPGMILGEHPAARRCTREHRRTSMAGPKRLLALALAAPLLLAAAARPTAARAAAIGQRLRRRRQR